MRTARAFLVLLAFVCLASVNALPQTTLPAIKIKEYKLKNGLTVLMHEVARACRAVFVTASSTMW